MALVKQLRADQSLMSNNEISAHNAPCH
jgi:hypothetical protein